MGGTFTDGYFSDGARTVIAKVPTTHFDLTRSVTSCLTEGASALGLNLEEFLRGLQLLRLATTIGTNSVVTGTGDVVGLIVKEGATSSLYGDSDVASALGVFVRPENVVGIEAGKWSESLLPACRKLVQTGVRQVVVSLSQAELETELQLREVVRQRYPAHYLRSIPLTLGSETSNASDDEVRTNTAVLNAYLSRPMAKLLYRTEGVLQGVGLGVPLMAVRSDGSCSRMPRTTAISTYSSGPAAGVGSVASEARRCGDDVALSFDMGGTTLDLGLVSGGQYLLNDAPRIRGVQVSLRVPEIVSVGLGGSSIAQLTTGEIEVGPQSAGAIPGPAAFGRGGTEPTLTDADLVAGFLIDGETLPGEITLDLAAATAALMSLTSPGGSAGSLGSDSFGVTRPTSSARSHNLESPTGTNNAVRVARQVRATAHQKAASAIGELLAASNVDPASVTLYAFGGAGSLHAAEVADIAGISRIRSFLHGGVFSARAVAQAPVIQRYESRIEDSQDAYETLAVLVGRAKLDLAAERLRSEGISLRIDVDCAQPEPLSRVFGIDTDVAQITSVVRGLLEKSASHNRLRRLVVTSITRSIDAKEETGRNKEETGRSDGNDDARGHDHDATPPPTDASNARTQGVKWSRRLLGWTTDGDAVDTTVLDIEATQGFSSLRAEQPVKGPALICCSGTVHAIAPGWTCRATGSDGLLWERAQPPSD